MVFWLSIILGQPLCVLLYFRDYMKGLSGVWTEADTQFYSKLLGALLLLLLCSCVFVDSVAAAAAAAAV